MRALLALVVALAAVGCYHDKYDVNGPKRGDDYYLPPNEDRYNKPDTATYRPPPDLPVRRPGGRPGGGPLRP